MQINAMEDYRIQENEFDRFLDDSYEDNAFYKETFSDVWNNCVEPSLVGVFYTLYKIILVNLLFSLILSTGMVSHSVFHILSGISGLILLTALHSSSGKVLILVFFSLSYFLLYCRSLIKSQYSYGKNKTNKGSYLTYSNILKYALITSLVLCEYFLLEAETWMEIRGIIMVFTMKLVSLADDIDIGPTNCPSFLPYFGYVFSGANIMFGPWIPFQDYILLQSQPTKKNIWWVYGVLKTLFISIFFLTISNCWTNFIISEDANRWLVGYKEALSFRTSHYFICYLSEASMLAAGYKNRKIWYQENEWRFFIVDPIKIEFPNALATVVTNWNRPMHGFLKTHIYKSWLPVGKFYAVLLTFIASSFLHGFELKVSVVLITIGVFSYLQYTVRNRMADAFSSCIRVHPCKVECNHKYKRTDVICRICLVVFSMLTVLHLIYLGIVMDLSTDEVGIYEKWNNLYFCSFWIMVVNVLLII